MKVFNRNRVWLVLLYLLAFVFQVDSIPIGDKPESSNAHTISPGYGTLTITTDGSITRAVINNPPINLWDYKLASDFSAFVDGLAAQSAKKTTPGRPTTKVVILSSANPDFFIAHYDVHVFSPTHPPSPLENGTLLGAQLVQTERNLINLPIISIAEINGRTAGAGNEIAVQCDIRYAGPKAEPSQLEVAFGFEPGSGGVQFLVQLIGRARALEYILTGRSVDAATAAAIGWVNTAFNSERELREGVDALAERIASMPAQGLKAVKARVNAQRPTDEELQGDLDLFSQLVPTTVVQEASDRYLDLSENQTKSAFELNEPQRLSEIVPQGS